MCCAGEIYERQRKMKMSGSPFFLEEDLLTAEDEIRRHLVLGQYNLLYAVKKLQVINHSVIINCPV